MDSLRQLIYDVAFWLIEASDKKLATRCGCGCLLVLIVLGLVAAGGFWLGVWW